MDVPFDVLKIVACYTVVDKMKLLDWINIDMNRDKLDWNQLSTNPNAIQLLEKKY